MAAAEAEHRIEIETTPQVIEYLEGLVSTGLYGESIEDAAERLICRQLRRLIHEGMIRKQTRRKDR